MNSILKLRITTSILIALLVIGCKNKKSNDPASIATGSLEFHLHTLVGSTEVADYDTIYTLASGRKISVSKAQLYISAIQLVKLDGSLYTIPNATVLKLQEIEQVTVATVPAGNYKSVRFSVGLDSAVNHQTPATSNTTLYRSDMWFGSSVQPDGFVFVNFRGMIDTSSAANMPNNMQSFSYKIGTNANLKQVSMPDKNFMVTPSGIGLVHITIDYDKLFTGVQLNKTSNLNTGTAADNAIALGILISNNIPSMFQYEQ